MFELYGLIREIMKKILLILILAIATNAWAEEEFNLTCNLIEIGHTVEESPKEGPKFKFKVANEWVYWTGEIPKNKSEQDLAIEPKAKVIEPKVKEYHLQVVFNEDMKGYMLSEEFTNGEKKGFERYSSLNKTRINIWTKGIFKRSYHIIINRLNGYISFTRIKPYSEFLGSCTSTNS